jgi:hypothetical protein
MFLVAIWQLWTIVECTTFGVVYSSWTIQCENMKCVTVVLIVT